jgi:light-regulated signal transduction histidine kinase (bacteriophytochrome)
MTERFPDLVLLACHDLRTPLATVRGFAATLLARGEMGSDERQWLHAVERGAEELSELLDLVGRATRIEAGTYEPARVSLSLAELAAEAATRIGDGRVTVSGVDDAEVELVVADRDDVRDALVGLGRCLLQHGALESIAFEIERGRVTLGPLDDGVAAIALGEKLHDLRAAIGVALLRSSGARVWVEGERLAVEFSAASGDR